MFPIHVSNTKRLLNVDINQFHQPEAVVVEFVIRSHCNETPPSTAQRVEDL